MPRPTSERARQPLLLCHLLVDFSYQGGSFGVPLRKLMTERVQTVIDRECGIDEAVAKIGRALDPLMKKIQALIDKAFVSISPIEHPGERAKTSTAEYAATTVCPSTSPSLSLYCSR